MALLKVHALQRLPGKSVHGSEEPGFPEMASEYFSTVFYSVAQVPFMPGMEFLKQILEN